MSRSRLLLAALAIAAAGVAARPAGLRGAFDVRLEAAQQGGAGKPAGPPAETEASGDAHASAEAGWKATIAKAVNFAILAGVLVYFLRTPLAGYLGGRISKVREDLATAAQTRDAASRQLAEIDAKLKGLPLELDALKRRGVEDLAAERARIAQAADAERQRLLEQTRRDIEMRLRLARRELVELTAELAVGVAADQIAATITPDDQTRLVDRFAAQLTAAPAPGAGLSGAPR